MPEAPTPPTNMTTPLQIATPGTPPTPAGQPQSDAVASLTIPTLTSLTPNTIAAGSANATVAVVGTGFDPSSVLMVAGVPCLKNVYNSAISLTCTLNHSQATVGVKACNIQNVNMLAKSGNQNFTYT